MFVPANNGYLFRMLSEIEVPSHGLTLYRVLVYIVEHVSFCLVIVSDLRVCNTNGFARVSRRQPPLLCSSLPRQRENFGVELGW